MVRWSGPAKKHLKQIYDYIAQDSKYYAKNVVRNIVDKSETLNAFPEIGRVVPEIDDPNVREVFIYSYRLIYELRVHSKITYQNWRPDLGQICSIQNCKATGIAGLFRGLCD